MEQKFPGSLLHYNNKKVWLRAFSSSIGYFIFGYVIGIFTSSQECVSSLLYWGDNKDFTIVIMSTLVPIGAFFGSILTGFLSKINGKRKNIMITDLLTMISSIIILYPHTITFAIGRFFMGMCVGNFSILCSQYITEVTPKEVRGKMGTVNQLLVLSGLFGSFTICLTLPIDSCPQSLSLYVFFLFAIPGFIAGFQFLIFYRYFKNESPEWLVYNKSFNTTFKAVSSIYIDEHAQIIMDELENSKNASKSGNGFSYTQLILCANGSTKATRVASLYHIFSQLSGINALLAYLTRLFIEFGKGVFVARCLISAVTFVRVLSVVFVLPHIPKFGRKTTTVYCEIIMSVCMFGLVFFVWFSFDPIYKVLLIAVYLVTFNLSVGPIVWIYSSEVLCDKGMALCTSINWFICIFVVLFYPVLVKAISMEYTFLGICIIDLIAAGYFALDMIETKHLSKGEIREVYSKFR
jgi:SP family arabinose:H+ symporter-like MFS transporter